MQRSIKSETDRENLLLLLGRKKLPFSVDIQSGRKRSLNQNALAFRWYQEIADQLGDHTADEVRAYCKLAIGVPILCADIPDFKQKYEVYIRPRPHEEKLAIMSEPFDFAVSRLMNVDQLTRYLDGIQKKFAPMGVELTQP